MLEKLTRLPKELVAIRAVVGKFRHFVVGVAIVREARDMRHVASHRGLLLRKLVDLLASIVFSATAGAVSALHVLHSIRPRSEPNFAANGTRHTAGTVRLRVHVEFVLVIEGSIAFATFVSWLSLDTVSAPRVTVTFHPLVVAERTAALILFTIAAFSSHS